MTDLKTYQQNGEELERRLRLKTFSLALKLLEREQDIPTEAKRPLKDFGHHLSLCQVFQMSRREGRTMAMLKEDHWCCEPVIGYGLGEPPAYFLEGHNRYPRDVATLEAGRHYALKCEISGHAACVYGVIPAIRTGECQVAVPCRGDHYRAMAGDEEMIFTVPAPKLDDLMLGLRSIEKTGSKLPTGYSFRPEYPLPESYKKIAEMMAYTKRDAD